MDYANIILEMLERIKKLEAELEEVKQRLSAEISTQSQIAQSTYTPSNEASSFNEFSAPVSKRDTTRYLFEGNVYLKNRLVLAVVQRYVADHPMCTRKKLKQVFPKTQQGSIGVVEDIEIAMLRNDYAVRFFSKTNEIIRLADGKMLVCNQWAISNITNFIKAAQQLGYTIKAI